MAKDMQDPRRCSRPTAPTEFTLTVHGPAGATNLDVVRGRGDDYFVLAPDSRVVAALVVLDRPTARAWRAPGGRAGR